MKKIHFNSTWKIKVIMNVNVNMDVDENETPGAAYFVPNAEDDINTILERNYERVLAFFNECSETTNLALSVLNEAIDGAINEHGGLNIPSQTYLVIRQNAAALKTIVLNCKKSYTSVQSVFLQVHNEISGQLASLQFNMSEINDDLAKRLRSEKKIKRNIQLLSPYVNSYKICISTIGTISRGYDDGRWVLPLLSYTRGRVVIKYKNAETFTNFVSRVRAIATGGGTKNLTDLQRGVEEKFLAMRPNINLQNIGIGDFKLNAVDLNSFEQRLTNSSEARGEGAAQVNGV